MARQAGSPKPDLQSELFAKVVLALARITGPEVTRNE